MTPARFGPYTLVRRIATGGTAEIFLARRHGVDGFARHVALKRILPHLSAHGDFVRLLLDEARLAAHLHHGHIVEIHDVGMAEGRAYIAMEYLPGVDLGRLLQRAGRRRRRVLLLEPDAARRAELGAALGAAVDVDLAPAADRDAAAAQAEAGPVDLALIAAGLLGPMRDPLLNALQARHPELLRVLLLGPVEGRGYGAYALSLPDPTPERVADVSALCLAPRLPLELTVQITRAVLDGLDAAHRAHDFAGRPLNIVHRDVNPGNVLLSVDGAVKLVDFGIARADNRARIDADGDLVGTCAYMSPEQAEGRDPDVRSDLFAVGTLLYEMATGVHPYRGETQFATLRAIREDAPAPLEALVPGLPAAFAALARRAGAQDAGARHPTAAAMLADVEDFARSEGLNLSPRRLAGFLDVLYTPEERRAFGVSDTGYEPREAPAEERAAPEPAPGEPPPRRVTVQVPALEPPPRRRRSDRAGRAVVLALLAGLAAMAGLYWHWRRQHEPPRGGSDLSDLATRVTRVAQR